MTMRTHVTNVGGSTVVAVDGTVDLASVGTLHGDLFRVVRRHPGAVLLVDLDAVDTSTMPASACCSARPPLPARLGGDLEVVCSRPALVERFRRSRFDRAVTVRTTIT